jgi:hypothetical protein
MKVTKQTTYNWDAGINVSEEETIAFANYLLAQTGKQLAKTNLSFEIAPIETEITTGWTEAKQYCNNLNVNGKIGWRLPTIEELKCIRDSENHFDTTANWWYWSSSYEKIGDKVWGLDFGDGLTHLKNTTGHRAYVRAVRTI